MKKLKQFIKFWLLPYPLPHKNHDWRVRIRVHFPVKDSLHLDTHACQTVRPTSKIQTSTYRSCMKNESLWVAGWIVPFATFKEGLFPFHPWNHVVESVANQTTAALDTWTSTLHWARTLKLLFQTSWARGQLHKQCVMSSKVAPHALQLLMPPLFPNHSPVGTARWVISQKNTLTLLGREEFHILLLVLSTKTIKSLNIYFKSYFLSLIK